MSKKTAAELWQEKLFAVWSYVFSLDARTQTMIFYKVLETHQCLIVRNDVKINIKRHAQLISEEVEIEMKNNNQVLVHYKRLRSFVWTLFDLK